MTRAPLHKRLARSIWTFLVWWQFMRQLWSYGWTERDCWHLAIGAAENNESDGAEYGWLFGKYHTSPCDAVQAELECWSD